jgi:hypothetical protein
VLVMPTRSKAWATPPVSSFVVPTRRKTATGGAASVVTIHGTNGKQGWASPPRFVGPGKEISLPVLPRSS